MNIILTSPQKEEWDQATKVLLRRCPFVKVEGKNIFFGDKMIGDFHCSDQEFQIQGDYEKGIKCVAMVMAEMTAVGFSGSIIVDGQPTELQDLQADVGDLIAEENFNLANKSSKN